MSYLNLVPAAVSLVGGIMGSNSAADQASLQALMQQRQLEAQQRANDRAQMLAMAGKNTYRGSSYYDPVTNQTREVLSPTASRLQGLSDANTEHALTVGAQRDERTSALLEQLFQQGAKDSGKYYADLRTGYRPSDEAIASQVAQRDIAAADPSQTMKMINIQALRSGDRGQASPLLDQLRGSGMAGIRAAIAGANASAMSQGPQLRAAMDDASGRTADRLSGKSVPNSGAPTINMPDIGGPNNAAASQVRGVPYQNPITGKAIDYASLANGGASLLRQFLSQQKDEETKPTSVWENSTGWATE